MGTRPKMNIKMLVFAAYFSMILNLVNAEETHSKCTGSFSECHALGLSTMEKFILTYELKNSMSDCVNIFIEEKCLQMIFNNDYFWSK